MNHTMTHCCKIFLNIVKIIVVILAAVFLLPKVIWFLMPFILGFIISKMASPIVTWLNHKIKVKRKALSATVMVVVVGLVILACYGIIVILHRQASGFIDQLPQMWNDTVKEFSGINVYYQSFLAKLPMDIQSNLNQLSDGITEAANELISKISSPTITAVGNFAMTIPSFLVSLIMTILSAYFFLAEKDYLSNLLQKIVPHSVMHKLEIIKKSLFVAVGGYLKAQLRIEVWMYLLLVIGLTFLGIKYALLVALGIAFLDFLPVFGTGTVLVPWAVIKFVVGDYKKAIVLLVMWLGGQLVRQLIQPKIVSSSVGLQPIPTLFLLYVGWKADGVFGMIVAVPIGLIIYNLHEAGVFDHIYETIAIMSNDLNAFCKYSKEDKEFYQKFGTTKEMEFPVEQFHDDDEKEASETETK